MQDNFNIHEWQLNRAINEIDKINEDEIGLSDILARNLFKLQGKISDDLFYKLRKAINSQDPAALAKAKEIMSRIKPEDDRIYMGEEKGQCPECGCKTEGSMCNECGYMEEGTNNIKTPFYFKSKMGIDGMNTNTTFQIQDIPDYGNIKVYYYDGSLPRFFWMYKDEFNKKIGEGDFIISDKSQFHPHMEEATFTDKHDDNPELKGGQKDLPDELQAGILKKEDTTGYSTDYKQGYRDGHEDGKKGKFGKQFAVKEGMDEKADRKFEVDDIVKVKGTGKKGKVVDMSPSETFFIVNIDGKNSSFHESDLELIKRPSLNENTDHEVSMAQASLKSIISSASELMNKIGNEEINLPGWIQGHITNAENYIDQANQGYHELKPSVKDIEAMDMVTEEVSANKKIKAKNALAIHLRSAMEDGNKENIEQVKDARDRINNTKSVDELVNILGEFGYKDDEIEDILG